jgi:hypothetical protein
MNDYSQPFPGYQRVAYTSANRKRQIIDAMLEELHDMHAEMIEQAMAYSDFAEARRVIAHIRGL